MFVFYDTETTGIDTDYSQILQGAYVFTDADLNILSSKKVECRNSPWIVPSPGALLVNGFVPDDLKFSKLSNYEMMREINDWVRSQHWPVDFIGYNSITFDEPMQEQNLHQNLLDQNLTTTGNDANGQFNGRADILNMVKVTALYMPGALKLDILNHFNLPSMKLTDVAEQNGVSLSEEDAHDALNDIKATVGVAKAVKKAAPQIWDHMIKMAKTGSVEAFMKANDVFTYADTDSYDHGKRRPLPMSAAVVTSVADTGGKAQALYKLDIDPTPYLDMPVEALKQVLLSAQSPFISVRRDNNPVLMPMDISDAVLPANYEPAVSEAHAQAIKSHPSFAANVAAAVAELAQEREATLPAVRLPEGQIDSGIPASVRPRLEQWACEFHHAANWHDRAKLVDDFYVRFKDDVAQDPALSRFVKFAGRLVYEHAPEELSPEKQEAMKKHIAARVLNPAGDASYNTIGKARAELEKIEYERGKGYSKWQHVTDTQVRALKLYYTAIEKEYAPYAPPEYTHANNNAPPVDTKKTSGGSFKPK